MENTTKDYFSIIAVLVIASIVALAVSQNGHKKYKMETPPLMPLI